MLLESLARLQENEVRLRQILLVLGKYGLTDWLGKLRVEWLRKLLVNSDGRRLDQVGPEERIRLALVELGATFIKLGQMLSTRPDLVGRTLATELSKLQAGAPADSIEVVRRTIEAEFGSPPEELFEEFCPQALASGSIAQVHRARLRGGQPVAVKIQHDGIESTIHRDLALMLGMAEAAQNQVRSLRSYRPVSTVREFRRTLLRELDLRAERRNLDEFSRNFSKDKGVHFPRAFPELCGRRVLTMELLEGLPGIDAGKVSNHTDLPQFVRRAATMYLDMIFRDGFYHADPHPGNYLILPGGVVGVLDCGMVGRLDEGLRDTFEAALFAVAQREVEELTDRVVRMGTPPANLDRDALRSDLAEFVAEYGSRPLRELDLGSALEEMTDIIARYRIILPANVALLLRTLAVLDGSARQMVPAFSLMDLIVEYRQRVGGSRVWQGRWLRDARRTVRGIDRMLRELPGDAGEILHQFRTGRLELKLEHRRLQASIHRLTEGMLAAAMLLSSTLLIGRSGEALPRLLGFGLLPMAGFLGIRLRQRIHAAERESHG